MNNKIILEIPFWVSHFNMLIYATYFYCCENKYDFEIKLNKKLNNGIVLQYKSKTVFLDYSDDIVFLENPTYYDCYFKRSLLDKDKSHFIFPLNFQVNFSYNSLKLLTHLDKNIFLDSKSRVEVVRSIDYFNKITNLSHRAMDISRIDKKKSDSSKIIFQTRLWNPDNNPSEEEKERRNQQNVFRINACRILKKEFNNAIVGIYPDHFSSKCSSDLLLDKKQFSKNIYLKNLANSGIAIADDGLKDTPGWKIGEYAMHGKAIITTPINTIVESFLENKNYLKLSNRNCFEEIPSKIEFLLKDNNYLEMGFNNSAWSNDYLHPKNYFNRIVSKIDLI